MFLCMMEITLVMGVHRLDIEQWIEPNQVECGSGSAGLATSILFRWILTNHLKEYHEHEMRVI